jgi:hypothetical protein
VAASIMRWFFNSASKHLIKLTAQAEEGVRNSAATGSTATGYLMVHQGNSKLGAAQAEAKRLRALLSRGDGVAGLNEAHIGMKRYRQIVSDIAEADATIASAEALITQGRDIVDKGLFDMPKLSTTGHSLEYYENLVRLAVVKHQLS